MLYRARWRRIVLAGAARRPASAQFEVGALTAGGYIRAPLMRNAHPKRYPGAGWKKVKPKKLVKTMRRGGRVAEGGGLLNRYTV